MIITIPEDFTILEDGLTTFRTLGTALNPSPEWNYDADTRILTVNKVNSININSLSFITLVIGPVTNPPLTEPTGSFTY